MPYIETPSGISWFYRAKGEGKTLVFIHGLSFDSEVWLKQLDSFSQYKVVTLDLPGHGNSTYKEKINLAEELKFIFDKLGLNSVNIVGHSLGGLLALKLAIDYPKLLGKIILIGANAQFVRSPEYEYGLSQADVEKLRGFIKGNYPEILLVFIRWLFSKAERRQSDFKEIWNLISQRKAWPKKEALEEFLSIIEQENLRSQLSKIDLPALVICGTEDPICPLESANYLGREVKNSRVELFQGCWHLPFLTESKKFNDIAKDFLK